MPYLHPIKAEMKIFRVEVIAFTVNKREIFLNPRK